MLLFIVLTIFTLASVGILLWQFFHGDLNDPLSDEWGVRWSLPRRK